MKIIYVGTPEYAFPPLNALLEEGLSVPMVITPPDMRQGRGRSKKAPPLKRKSLDKGLHVYQPESINSEQARERIASENPDLLVLCSFGKILSEDVLDIPDRGSINIHPSLLPRYRGPAPVVHTLLNGEEETGVTIFRMNGEVDAGPIIEQVRTEVDPYETTGELRDRLFSLAAEILPGVITDIREGRVRISRQDEQKKTRAPRLSKEDGRIDWNQSVREVWNHIRAMQPWPKAFSWLELSSRGQTYRVNIKEGRIPSGDEELKSAEEAGDIAEVTPREIRVQTGDGIFCIQRLQPENKQMMEVRDFINGYQPEPGDRFLHQPPNRNQEEQ